MTAIGLLHAARRAGVPLPGRLAVVGFDDIPFASYVQPPLTTIAQPKGEMGRRAVEMALALMAEDLPVEAFSDIVVQGELIVRQSSGSLQRPA
jgi:DNA-binding LacI/PurR family transcriptional regulator